MSDSKASQLAKVRKYQSFNDNCLNQKVWLRSVDKNSGASQSMSALSQEINTKDPILRIKTFEYKFIEENMHDIKMFMDRKGKSND